MKRYYITTLLFIFSIGFASSQSIYQVREAIDFFRINKLNSGEWSNTLTESNVQGSPYLNDQFVNGTIFTTSKQKFVDVPLRYNIYNDQLEFKTPENRVMAMATPEIIEVVEFGEYKMVYLPYSNAKKIRHGFFKVEEEGNVSLYSRLTVAFKKAEGPGGYKEAEPAKFVKKPNSYYISTGTGQAKKVESKKGLIEMFPDHQNEVTAFIKKNKIKTNKLVKLKKLVAYYNSL